METTSLVVRPAKDASSQQQPSPPSQPPDTHHRHRDQTSPPPTLRPVEEDEDEEEQHLTALESGILPPYSDYPDSYPGEHLKFTAGQVRSCHSTATLRLRHCCYSTVTNV